MRIALDYDETYTDAPELFKLLVQTALEHGHTIFFATYRCANGDNSDIESDAEMLGIKIFYTEGQQKQHVVHADVWIDDQPQTIVNAKMLGKMHHGCLVNNDTEYLYEPPKKVRAQLADLDDDLRHIKGTFTPPYPNAPTLLTVHALCNNLSLSHIQTLFETAKHDFAHLSLNDLTIRQVPMAGDKFFTQITFKAVGLTPTAYLLRKEQINSRDHSGAALAALNAK
jgi:hypothetical protein